MKYDETKILPQLKCSKPALKAVSNSKSGVKITWSKVKGGDSYIVYRKTASGSYTKIGTTKNNYFVDKTAKSGTKYFYAVSAKNEAGVSARSGSLSIKRLSVPKLSAVSNASAGVKITWKKVTGASNYIVYRKKRVANGTQSRKQASFTTPMKKPKPEQLITILFVLSVALTDHITIQTA